MYVSFSYTFPYIHTRLDSTQLTHHTKAVCCWWKSCLFTCSWNCLPSRIHTSYANSPQSTICVDLNLQMAEKEEKITTVTKKTRIFTVNCDTGINISHWWFWCENRAVFIADTNAICGFPLCGAHTISATYIGAEYVSKMKIICCDFIAWLVWLSTKLCCNFHFHTFCFENVPSCGDYYVGFIYCWLFSHCNFMQVYPPPSIALSLSFCLDHMRKPQTRLLLFISVNGFWACLIFAQLNLVVMFTAV